MSDASAPFSAAVMAGNTLYVSGAIDTDPVTGKLGGSPEESAKFALDALKKSVETSGYVFATAVRRT
jgi:2-iminobutanoate/2-iminopropanoate deaminase